jgi:hypothetical protein
MVTAEPEPFKTQELYGGALLLSMPERFADVRSAWRRKWAFHHCSKQARRVLKLLIARPHALTPPPPHALCSDARPVPDHQEVWADPDEDQSLVVEVVEWAGDVGNEEVGR